LTAEQARLLAKSRLGQLASGIDVNRSKRLGKIRGVTLDAVFTAFCAARPGLKLRTTQGYRELIGRYLADWRNLPWTSIFRAMVLDRHRLIGEEHGQRTANNAMRALRSILSFARAKYRDPATQEPLTNQNPVSVLNDSRSWFTESRRTDYLKPSEIRQWWDAVGALWPPACSPWPRVPAMNGRSHTTPRRAQAIIAILGETTDFSVNCRAFRGNEQ
jgi:hypothetical protein